MVFHSIPTQAGPWRLWAGLLTLALASPIGAQAQSNAPGWQGGVVLDTSLASSKPELASRDKGSGLGHSDVMVRGPLGEHFSAEVIGALHTVYRRLETHWESAWVQTRRLPDGWQMRAGRFAPQVGYWNDIHPHAEDFAERGLLQRAFFGGPWVDDGLRVNWTAPTSMNVRLGVESLSGRKLIPEANGGGAVQTYSLKPGDDWNTAHSWQWGLPYVNNRRGPTHLQQVSQQLRALPTPVLGLAGLGSAWCKRES